MSAFMSLSKHVTSHSNSLATLPTLWVPENNSNNFIYHYLYVLLSSNATFVSSDSDLGRWYVCEYNGYASTNGTLAVLSSGIISSDEQHVIVILLPIKLQQIFSEHRRHNGLNHFVSIVNAAANIPNLFDSMCSAGNLLAKCPLLRLIVCAKCECHYIISIENDYYIKNNI
jgi:hypothetical protein